MPAPTVVTRDFSVLPFSVLLSVVETVIVPSLVVVTSAWFTSARSLSLLPEVPTDV